MKKELLIHFTDVSVCLNNLKEIDIKISPICINKIKLLHNCVMIINAEMPENIIAEVCYRTANRIIKLIEMETKIRFVKYNRSNYLLK